MRGGARVVNDVYETPPWVTRLMVERGLLPRRAHYLDPCAGHGALIREAMARNGDSIWSAVEIRKECEAKLRKHLGNVLIADFLELDTSVLHCDVVMTNPPYALAQPFIAQSLLIAPLVVMLLRLNFLGGAERARWLRANMPQQVLVLPNRPSYTGKATDSCEYAWFVWDRARAGTGTQIEILPELTLTERRVA